MVNGRANALPFLPETPKNTVFPAFGRAWQPFAHAVYTAGADPCPEAPPYQADDNAVAPTVREVSPYAALYFQGHSVRLRHFAPSSLRVIYLFYTKVRKMAKGTFHGQGNIPLLISSLFSGIIHLQGCFSPEQEARYGTGQGIF